ncbi:MAG: hypothetical protein FVQ83_03810 [Chloroflexi bacterium]|nr:hypothetical protein [Chloroflexota bacterium]
MKSKLLFLSLLLTTLLFSACTVKFTTVINSDESGEFKILLSLSEDDIDAIEDEMNQDFEDFLDDETNENDLQDACESVEDESDLPRGATVKYSDRSGTFTCEITIPFDDLDELEEIYADMGLASVNRLRINSDGELDYEVDLLLYGMDDPDDIGIDDFDFSWNVEVPGKAVNDNSDDSSGNTLTWDLDPRDDNVSVEVESEPGTSIWLWVAIIGGLCFFGLLVLGGGGAAYYFTQKKKQEA